MFGKLRERYERVMMRPGKFLARLGATPNSLTVGSVFLSAISGWLYFSRDAVAGAVLLIAAAFLDMMDGAVARASGRTSRFGTVFDHVLDRYAEFFVLLGITLGGFVEPVWSFFALFGMVMASFTRAKAESVGGLESCTVGIAERQEKLILLVAGSFASVVISQALLVAVIVVGVLSHVTVIQRLHFTLVKTRGK